MNTELFIGQRTFTLYPTLSRDVFVYREVALPERGIDRGVMKKKSFYKQ